MMATAHQPLQSLRFGWFTLSACLGNAFQQLYASRDNEHETKSENAEHENHNISFPLVAHEPCVLAAARQRKDEGSHSPDKQQRPNDQRY